MSLLSVAKRAILPVGARPRRVLSGAFRGLKMEVDLQSASQFWAGLYERETYRWLVRLGEDCRAGIDVGAAKGEFTLYLLKRTDALQVLAFDPNEENAATFSRNLELNGLGGDRRLRRYQRFVGSGARGTVRLDSFAESLSSPLFIRVDVDGLEMGVLEGMKGLFTNMRVRLLLETHSAELECECVAFLAASGLRTRIVGNAWWRVLIRDQRPIELNRWLVASNDPSCRV